MTPFWLLLGGARSNVSGLL